MTDVKEMWYLFSKELKHAVNKAVSVKSVILEPSSQLHRFVCNTNKLVTKHRKTYNKYKYSADLFFFMKYKQETLSHCIELHNIEQDYISTKICKSLKTSSSKPFHQHLLCSQGVTKTPRETQD